MLQKRTRTLCCGTLLRLAVCAALVAACGGQASEPPPASPSPAPSGDGTAARDDAASAPPNGGRKLDGPAAPASGDDVKKGIAALRAGDVNGARAAFEVAVKTNPNKADAHHYLGVVDDQMGNKVEAEKHYRKALELDPNLEESAVNLAALLLEGGKNDEASALMKRAIAKNPKNAALHVNLGMALSGKDDAGAAKAFEEAIKLEPANGIHLVTYASQLAKTGKKDEAITRLKQAEKVAASDPGVLASIGLEYKGMKDFKSCVAVLDKAVGQKDVAELRIYRGACKLGLKDLPGATTEFKDAVAKEPNNAVAHYSLGNALADAGKLADAITEWETYLKLAPDGPQAKAAERKIKIAKEKAGGAGKPPGKK